MVGHVLKVVYKEIRGLHQAAYILALFTLGSQILAIVRDRLLAHQFGAGIELDLYYAAFRVPDLFFVIFASVLSVYVLIPFVSARLDGEAEGERGKALLSQLFTLFLIVYAVLAGVAFLVSPMLATFFFPGFTGVAYEELVLLMRILLLQPFLLSLSSLYGVVTQLSSRFVLYALSPLLYNLGIIAGVVILYPMWGLSGLAWGVVLGALLHLVVQIPYVGTSPLAPRLTRAINLRECLEVLRVSLPRALTLSLHQLVILSFVGIASIMAAGSVSVIQFAFNLQSVPLALIGVSYSVAAFPTLARMYSAGDRSGFITHVGSALRHIFFWSIPVIALVVVVRAQIVRVILGTGQFDWDDTRLTAAALALFVVSLASQAVNLLIMRAFYAGGDTRTPFIVTLFSSFIALLSGIGFYIAFLYSGTFAHIIERLLRVSDVLGTEVLVLPLGYTLALLIHSTIIVGLFMKKFGLPKEIFFGTLWRSITGALVGGLVAYLLLNILAHAIRNETFLGIFLQGFIAGAVGLLVTGGTLYVLRSPELKEVWTALHRRLTKKDIVGAPISDDLAV